VRRPRNEAATAQLTRTQDVPVVYVLGIYRSGTTLLSNLLGQLDGYFCGGELRALWRELLDPESRCGCGNLLRECDLWQEIIAAGFGGDDEGVRRTATEMLELQTRLLGWKHTWLKVPGLLRRTSRPLAPDDPLARYAEGMRSLYRAIVEVTGAKVIVDSSKEAADASVVRALLGVRPVLVHIVRDPRGTVYSSLRIASGGREVDESHWGASAYTAMSWSVGNLGASVVCRSLSSERRTSIRYEDFVARPLDTLERIAALAGEPAPVPMVDDNTVLVAPTHTVAGNDNRFRTGPIRVQPDTAWRVHLHPIDRAVISGLCLPLLARYHYPIVVRENGPIP
jgi:hypothetical protein